MGNLLTTPLSTLVLRHQALAEGFYTVAALPRTDATRAELENLLDECREITAELENRRRHNRTAAPLEG